MYMYNVCIPLYIVATAKLAGVRESSHSRFGDAHQTAQVTESSPTTRDRCAHQTTSTRYIVHIPIAFDVASSECFDEAMPLTFDLS